MEPFKFDQAEFDAFKRKNQQTATDVRGQGTPRPDIRPEDIGASREMTTGQMVAEGARQTARIGLPVAAAALTGGASIPVQIGAQLATEAGMAATGVSPISAFSALSAVPAPAIKYGSTLKRGVQKGAFEVVSPSGLRGAGSEVIANRLGQPMTPVERMFQTPASKALYDQAKKAGGKVNISSMQPSLQAEVDAVKQPLIAGGGAQGRTAVRDMQTFIDNLAQQQTVTPAKPTGLLGPTGQPIMGSPGVTSTPGMNYEQTLHAIQALNENATSAFSTGHNVKAQALKNLRAKALDMLDQSVPELKEANMAYRREAAAKDILHVATSTGDIRSKMTALLEGDPSIAKAFGKDAINDVMATATLMADVASTTPAGASRQIMSAFLEPAQQLLQTPEGRTQLRNIMASKPQTAVEWQTKLNMAAQSVRAYGQEKLEGAPEGDSPAKQLFQGGYKEIQ